MQLAKGARVGEVYVAVSWNVSTVLDAERLVMSPPLRTPFRHRGGVSSFAVRRWRDQPSRVTGYTLDGPGYHQGIDLLAGPSDPDGAVFSVAWGEIVSIDVDGDGCKNVRVLHRHSPVGFTSQYFHITDGITLASGTLASSGISVGEAVRPGQLLGFICPMHPAPHLHFELRVETEPWGASSRPASVPIDPTAMLYRFEADRWPSQRGQPTYGDWSMNRYGPITRLSIRPWKVEHADNPVVFRTAHLLEVMFEDEDPKNLPDGTKAFYVPVEQGTERERRMVDLLRDAFRTGAHVKLFGRDSIFFGERKMIEEVRTRPARS